MRVLHVYSGNLYGGIESVLVTLATERRLTPAMKPHFGLGFGGRLHDALVAAGTPVYRLGDVRMSRPASVWRARRTLKDLLSRVSFEVAVAHSPWALAVFGPPVRAAQVPLVLWLHNPMRSRHWVDAWARRTVPDLVVANSRYTADTVHAVYPSAPVEWVYSPVPPPARAVTGTVPRLQLRSALQTPDDAVVVLQASRLEPWKGQMMLLEALGRLRPLPGWVAWIAGGPQRAAERRYADALRRAAVDHGIADRVRFIGERHDVAALMRAADVYCQPNVEPEPFGIVFLEALWAGLPVVTSASGGACEILNDTCGVLVPPRDPAALAVALQTLVIGGDSRARLGEAGPTRARELCGPQTQMPRVHDVLQRVTAAE